MDLNIGDKILNNQGIYFKIINKYKNNNLCYYDCEFEDGTILKNKYLTNSNLKKVYNINYDNIIGRRFKTNNFGEILVLKKDITFKIGNDFTFVCKFEDGTISNFRKQDILRGSVKNPKDNLLNKIISSNFCGDFIVLKKLSTLGKSDNSYQYLIRFIDTNKEYIVDRSQILNKSVNDLYAPNPITKIYLGEGKYKLINYRRIKSILDNICNRCFNPNSYNYKNYGAKGIIVCDEWLNFQNFCQWYLDNSKWNLNNFDLDLDKDILSNIQHLEQKVYSSNTCLLIPSELNRFLKGDNCNCGIFIKNKNFITKFFNKFNSFKEAKIFYAKKKYEHWEELINKYNLPNDLKEILLKYDFSWSWIWENMTEEEIREKYYGSIER